MCTGKFEFQFIGDIYLPIITRVVNGKNQKFASIRMFMSDPDDSWLQVLVRSSMVFHHITAPEANLLNRVNKVHYNEMF